MKTTQTIFSLGLSLKFSIIFRLHTPIPQLSGINYKIYIQVLKTLIALSPLFLLFLLMLHYSKQQAAPKIIKTIQINEYKITTVACFKVLKRQLISSVSFLLVLEWQKFQICILLLFEFFCVSGDKVVVKLITNDNADVLLT